MHNHIVNAKRIGIFTHINEDGDALGSSMGLAGYLESLGKEYILFLPSKINGSISFIVPEDRLGKVTVWNDGEYSGIQDQVRGCDLLIGLDFNVLDRIGRFRDLFSAAKCPKILVDHHLNPERDAFDLVYSRTDISSTCELLYQVLKGMPEIDGDAAKMTPLTREGLLTGMTTDTNNFANSVYPTTLQMASELIAAGTDRDGIISKLYFCYPERRVRVQGYILDNLLKITDDGVAYMVLDRRVQERFSLEDGDTEGFVNIPLSVDKVRMSFLLKQELSGNNVRVSIRSKKGTSAQKCATQYFHGGGHENASGGKLIIGEDISRIEDAGAYIEEKTSQFLKGMAR